MVNLNVLKNYIKIEYYGKLIKISNDEIITSNVLVTGKNLIIVKMNKFLIEAKGDIVGVNFIEK